MNIIIFGGSGFIGRNLAYALSQAGHSVTIVTRKNKQASAKGINFINWDYISPVSFNVIPGHYNAVVNLAGESLNSKRWTPQVKKKILKSRTDSTSAIVTAINTGKLIPDVLVNASGAGYYGNRGDDKLTEDEGPGDDFLAFVCRKWEQEAYKVSNNHTRVITLRTGVVLGREGALKSLILPFRFFVGGTTGTGDQWFPWIHIDDFTAIIIHIINKPSLSGPVNAAAPGIMRMRDFSNALGEVLNRPSWFRVPGFLLSTVIGEMSLMITGSQRVVPAKILSSGFEFRYPEVNKALENLC